MLQNNYPGINDESVTIEFILEELRLRDDYHPLIRQVRAKAILNNTKTTLSQTLTFLIPHST